MSDEPRDVLLAVLEKWRKELIDPTRRNRLLNFSPLKVGTGEIDTEHTPPDKVVTKLLVDGGAWEFHFPPDEVASASDETLDADLTMEYSFDGAELQPEGPYDHQLRLVNKSAPEVSKTLRKLATDPVKIEQDRGIWTLYLAAGFLKWKDPETKHDYFSPLALIPVSIQRERRGDPYQLKRREGDIEFNPALRVRLGEFGITLGNEADDPDSEDGWLTRQFQAVRQQITGQPTWSVEERLFLGMFAFYKEVMYRDLEANHDRVAEHSLIKRLAIGMPQTDTEPRLFPPSEEDLDDKAPPEETITVLEADASQRVCIALAQSGESFVIDGPPGTGKSQTIANVIAALLADGKTVLFVSEKAAALEVVQNRLAACQLEDFILAAHSQSASRREIAQSLSKQLLERPTMPRSLNQEDFATLRASRRYLSERTAAMHEVRQPLGMSLSTALGSASRLIHAPQSASVAAVSKLLKPEEYAAIMTAARQLSRAWGPVKNLEDFAWLGLRTDIVDHRWEESTRANLAAVSKALGAYTDILGELSDRTGQLMPTSLRLCDDFVELVKLASGSDVPPSWLTTTSETTTEVAMEFAKDLDELRNLESSLGASASLSAGQAQEALAQLSHIRCDIGSDLPEAAMTSRREAGELPIRLKMTLEELEASTASVIQATDLLGIERASLTPSRIQQIHELAELTGTEDRPDVAWLAISKVKMLRTAVSELKQARGTERTAAEVGREWFLGSITTVDIGDISARLATASKATFKSLRGEFRGLKNLVSLYTSQGTSFEVASAHLDAAIGWKAASDATDLLIAKHQGILGEHFPLSRELDLERVSRAGDTAQRVLDLCGSDISPTTIGSYVGAGRVEDPQLTAWARDAKLGLDQLTTSVCKSTQLTEDTVWGMRLDALAEFLVSARNHANVLAGIYELVPGAANFSEAVGTLERKAQVDELRNQLANDAISLGESLDTLYAGEASDTEKIRKCVSLLGDIRALMTAPFTLAGSDALVNSINDEDRSDLTHVAIEWATARTIIAEQFDDDFRPHILAEFRGAADEVEALITALVDQVKDVREWTEYVVAKRDLVDLDFEHTVELCISKRVDADIVPDTIKRAMLESWIEDVLKNEGRIEHLTDGGIRPHLDDFRTLDRRLASESTKRVIDACVGRRPNDSFRSGEYQVIEREGAKKRRHMPVRTLLEKAGSAAQALKPCFMMSPLTVSQFLPSTMTFDAVIFDEASQVPPADAISSIYRGRQLIIAGDQLQLPPTRFFSGEADEDDVYVEDEPDSFESILDAAKATGGFPSNRLRWHYRSQHEDLITYSNYRIYDGELTTFPGAIQRGDDLGVEMFFVSDGCYEGRGRNPIEADRVADQVMRWAEWNRDNPDRQRTVGVVAMSRAHADDIEEAVYRKRRERDDLESFFVEDRLTGFFVKNLENVQGDERDVMIMSVGYGPDKNGNVKMQFGPISQAMGKRRLNVAITRAKRRVEVFTSLDHRKIRVASEESGTKHLKGYLAFAEQGPASLELEIRQGPSGTESPFEDSVVDTIRSWGFDAHTQVGSSGYRIDIGIRDPNDPDRYILGVECDGAQYHSGKTARDRDRLRQEVLENRGWTIHRIWGTDWYRFRSAAEQSLRAAIEHALPTTGRSLPTETTPPTEVPVVEYEPIDPSTTEWKTATWAEPYQTAWPDVPGGKTNADISDNSQRSRIDDMVFNIVETEGPVHIEIIATRVRTGWGLQRTTKKVSDAVLRSARRLERAGSIERLDKDFFYKSDDQLKLARHPELESEIRRVQHVASCEIGLVLLGVTEQAHSIDEDELTLVTAQYFGWARRGRGIIATLTHALQDLLEEGTLIQGIDGLYRVRR